ncbi:KdsC family phosphatase [Phocaeicola paurosaccharolyticus]|uniref:KdsC family phosphatase n=1 Tax=Phocaeicola paurosaccharolyticus TaxID=732242 RepID=UPI00046AB369|nr:HAD hydrolase family protein [Phocaeicola paurosaccharolyticus]
MEISLDELRERAAKIKWFFCDIDGTLTDGCVYYSPEGELLKKFSLRDGTGFFLLRQAGIKTGFITTENSPIVEQRAKKLKIDKYIFGTHKKLEAMQEFVQIEGLSMENIAFIGDELNDVKLLRACGLGIAVGDADKRAKNSSIVICEGLGGRGAFREAVEILLDLRGFDFEKIINNNL